jgi:hypothetical protein
LEALKDFPSSDTKLYTEKGLAFCQKTDIFKGMLWFSYKDDASTWHELTKEQVKEILHKNKKKEKVASLEEYTANNYVKEEKVFENAVGQDSLTRFDRPKKSKSRNRKRNKNQNRNRQRNQKGKQGKQGGNSNQASSNQGKNKNKKRTHKRRRPKNA